MNIDNNGAVFSMPLDWVLLNCGLSALLQGVLLSIPILLSSLIIRLAVRWLPLTQNLYNLLSIILGCIVLYWYYDTSIIYFILVTTLAYLLLILTPANKRGGVMGGACVMFIVTCELLIVSPEDWHQVRGSFLILSMKLVSLAYDIDGTSSDKPPPLVPDVLSMFSYALFPSTIIFGPFVTYFDHLKFMRKTPLSLQWFANALRSLLLSAVCFAVAICAMPFLFREPHWNRWFAAYADAGSFRYSHYFVCYISECTAILSGLGSHNMPSGQLTWSQFRVVHPLDIEWPRSMPIVVTSWNLPMHHFLKNYVFKPAIVHTGRFGAILITYIASALLHGLNFQLAAVLISIGTYSYIENVFRYKLSKRLSACIKDRPCSNGCSHKHKPHVFWVTLLNVLFTMLAIFHLAYLGLMFGGKTDEHTSAEQGYSMMHTLRKWSYLSFLSHWIALGTWVLSLVL